MTRLILASLTIFALAACNAESTHPPATPAEETTTEAPLESTKTSTVVKTAHFGVKGMTCGGCVAAVRKKIGTIPAVVDCDVSLEGQSATVDLSNADAASAVENAIRSLGYTVTVTDEVDGGNQDASTADTEKPAA